MIPIHLAVEDDLSEAVLRKLLLHSGRPFAVQRTFSRGGFGYLKKHIAGWNQGAAYMPFLVLTDLDQDECPSDLIRNWLVSSKHPNLLLRVAVRETESWLMGDSANHARFLRVPVNLFPPNPEIIADPKALLVSAASRSRSREIRLGVAPFPNSTAKQGREYNFFLSRFVREDWDVNVAARASESLARTVMRLNSFRQKP